MFLTKPIGPERQVARQLRELFKTSWAEQAISGVRLRLLQRGSLPMRRNTQHIAGLATKSTRGDDKDFGHSLGSGNPDFKQQLRSVGSNFHRPVLEDFNTHCKSDLECSHNECSHHGFSRHEFSQHECLHFGCL